MKIDLTFWLILALLTSVSANFLAFYYIRVLLGKLFYVGENLSDLAEMITSYRNHIKAVYGMEMFYGDQTLQGLIRHSREMINEIIDLQERYFLEEEEDFDRTQKEEEDSQEEKESILYRSPSESDS